MKSQIVISSVGIVLSSLESGKEDMDEGSHPRNSDRKKDPFDTIP